MRGKKTSLRIWFSSIEPLWRIYSHLTAIFQQLQSFVIIEFRGVGRPSAATEG
jgi:hypothetical protein